MLPVADLEALGHDAFSDEPQSEAKTSAEARQTANMQAAPKVANEHIQDRW